MMIFVGLPRRWRRFERELVVRVLHRMPLDATRRLRPWLTRRYADEGGTAAPGRLHLGHQLLLDLRSSVQATAYFSGVFDDELITLAQTLLDRPGAVAVDVGANIGFWTVPLARRAREVGGRVIAFEPVAANRNRLVDNVRFNGVEAQVEIIAAALSDRNGTIALALREEFAAGATTGNASVLIADGGDDPYATETAETMPLDSLDPGVTQGVRVVKVDVEGHEDQVLRGGMETLARERPVIIAEWNPVFYRRRDVDPVAAVDAMLAELDYTVLRKGNSGYQRAHGFHSHRELDNLLMVPAEQLEELDRFLGLDVS
jgi:FkbM family methyltransferase